MSEQGIHQIRPASQADSLVAHEEPVGNDSLRRLVEATLPVAHARAALLYEIRAALEAGDEGGAIALMRRYCGLPPASLAA